MGALVCGQIYRRVQLQHDLGALIIEGADDRHWTDVVADVRAGNVGGVLLFASARSLKERVAELRAVAPGPILIAVDGEGGLVRRDPELSAPSAAELGAMTEADARAQSEKLAKVLASAGVTLNLAPVVDLAKNPNGPIARAGRSLGRDPHAVSLRAAIFCAAHTLAGVHTTLKHFPGLGSAETDSHTELPDISQQWSADELIPYQERIAAGFRDAILLAHARLNKIDPNLPTSLSPAVVTGLLREQLKFSGTILTDDLQMGALSQQYGTAEAGKLALMAGVDMLLVAQRLRYESMANLVEFLAKEVEAGHIPRTLVTQAVERAERLKR